ncbi:ABC transporter substrate-binding protein [Pseudolabrys sp. FHR47]|uniref:ABC transporter substrate-binding protein n=1 Tax=Pseudolabrys sp. FHR47 TaxID=2562284 RepID=UPI0010BF09BA|nr:ABC transporter substrate-binding protein [Pseudolabrys sp. FHR47]
MTIKRLISFGLAFVLAAAVHAPAFAQTKISVGYIPAMDFLPAFVAKEQGLFEKNGLDVTLKPIVLASNVASAMTAGDVQIGLGTGPNMMMANEGGLDLVAVYGLTRDTKQNPIVGLIARKGSGIKTAADLVGKKIAVPGLNSVVHIFAMEWVAKNGVNPNKVTFIELPLPQMGSVLKGGLVDAIAVIEPFRGGILRDPDSVLVANIASDLRDNMMMGYWQSLRSWAKANPGAVKAFRASMDQGLAFIQQNPEEAKKIAGKYLRVVPPTFPVWQFKQTADDFQYQADISRELGFLKKPVDANALIWK